MMQQRIEAKEPLTAATMQTWIAMHRELAQAKFDAASDDASRMAAWIEFRDWAKEKFAEALRRTDVSAQQTSQLQYAIADAQYEIETRGGE